MRSALQSFTGTTEYHPHWSGLRFTDGVKFLVDHANAAWFLNVIAVLQEKALRDSRLLEFQLWELFGRSDRSVAIFCSRDSENVAFRLTIGRMDFPLDYVRVYVRCGIVFLPSENSVGFTS